MTTFIEMLSDARVAKAFLALLAVTAIALATPHANAASLADGAKAYKPFAVERSANALAAAKEMQAAVRAGDAKAAQAAWIKSRKNWEEIEPITGEFFSKLDEAIDAWPDAKKGYHAIEAGLFAGKLIEIAQPVDDLVANLAEFNSQVSAPNFQFSPQGLINGATKLAYELGENKSKGGESPYAGTSLLDMRENQEGIEVVFKVAFEPVLKSRDAKLAKKIDEQIEALEDLLKVDDLKKLDQPKVKKAGEELAVLLQNAALKLKLKKPAVGE